MSVYRESSYNNWIYGEIGEFITHGSWLDIDLNIRREKWQRENQVWIRIEPY